jgi:hypothetical protein
MEKSILRIFALVFLSIFALQGNALAGKVLVDTFSSGYLDDARWWPREYVREVVNGQYTSKLGNSIGMGAEVFPGIFRVGLPLADSGEITAIQAEITLVEAIRDKQASDAKSFAMICGLISATKAMALKHSGKLKSVCQMILRNGNFSTKEP